MTTPEPDTSGAPGDASAADESPLGAAAAGREESALDERPELLAGAAFIGGFALAQILKRLGQ